MRMKTVLCAWAGLLMAANVSFAEIEIIYHDGTMPVRPAGVPETPWVAREHVRIEPMIGWMAGESTYHIDGVVEGQSWASELRFPLDTLMAGVDASATLGEVSIGGRFSAGLTDPIGSLEDRDWVPDGILRGYTESDVELNAMMIDGYAKVPVYMGPGFWMGESVTLYGIGEYTHQRFEFKAFGADGWDSFDSPRARPDVAYEPNSTKVLDYRVQYDMFCVGGGMSDRFGPSVDFEGRILGGLVWVKDEDDHVLRSKLSKGEAIGIVMKVHGSGSYNFALLEGGGRWYLKGAMDFLVLGATGDQTQTFYDGSDVSTEVDYDDTSAQVVLSGALGCAF